MRTIRVLLVDDNVDFLEVACDFLSLEPGIQVVGQARNGRDGVAEAERLRPDLVITDLEMPGLKGMQVIARVKHLDPAPRVFMLTLHDEPLYRQMALDHQADAFMSKMGFTRQLRAAIQLVFPNGPGGASPASHGPGE